MPFPDTVDIETEVNLDLYPGSRRVRRGLGREDDPDETAGTEDIDAILSSVPSRTMTVRGEEVEFWSISALALALGRQVVTMRKWEQRGHLPAAPYRSRGEKQDRLYTRAHIEGIRAIAMEEGLIDAAGDAVKRRFSDTNFVPRVRKLFALLKGVR